MDRKTGRPILSLKFKAPPAEADQPAAQPTEIVRKPQVSGREPFIVPKVPSRKQGIREVVVARPAAPQSPFPDMKAVPAKPKKGGAKKAPAAPVEARVEAAKPAEAKQVPIPPAAFKAATKAATQAVASVLEDPAWQSADLQRGYQDAKLRAEPVHRKQAKLISGIVLKRLAPDIEEGETKALAMRAAYAAAFVVLVGDVAEENAPG